jgi:hypothetical protein
METEAMSRVNVAVKIENLGDLDLAKKGLLPAEQSARC